MESLFFNLTDKRYQKTDIFRMKEEYISRVDISNGMLFYEINLCYKEKKIAFKNMDRMVMIVMVKEGTLRIEDHIKKSQSRVQNGMVALYCSSKQETTLWIESEKASNILIFCIADFFLKRYLLGRADEPIDFLYGKIQNEHALECLHQQPLDALSLFIVENLLNVKDAKTMESIRAEHHVVEFMIHQFSLLDIVHESLNKEETDLAFRAKSLLLKEFVDPPTIGELAHLCATNETKLKKVFKKVYKSTILTYIQKLRLEQANLLLKEESLTIGEIANRVGYKHQGYFSKLFFKMYGVYPTALLK